MPVWPRRTIRIFGLANLGLGILGLALMSDYPIHLRYYVRLLRKTPDQLQIFCVLAGFDLACVVVLIFSGALLWRLRPSGRVVCNVLFAFEILNLGVPALLSERLFGSTGAGLVLARSIAGAVGVAGIGTAPQEIIGYPIIALIGINLAYHRLKQPQAG